MQTAEIIHSLSHVEDKFDVYFIEKKADHLFNAWEQQLEMRHSALEYCFFFLFFC